MSNEVRKRFKTPLTGHQKTTDFDSVYEPAEDSFLLLDALEKEDLFLQALKPSICLEVGCGSGICITFLSQMLLEPALCFCTDINGDAALMAARTGSVNQQLVLPVVGNLADPLAWRLAGSVDVLLFNPPYVVTPSEEVNSGRIEASWAGGVKGREVIDRFLPKVPELMSSRGVVYMVIIQENDAGEIEQIMKEFGFCTKNIVTRRAGGELLSILKFYRAKS